MNTPTDKPREALLGMIAAIFLTDCGEMSFSLAACAASCAALLHRPQPSCTAIGRSPTPRMQGAAGAPRDRGAERKTAAEDERDLTWFYASDDSQKVFSDYEWDPDFPGTFKPGLKRENYDFDEVVEMWKDRPNENVMRLHLDEARSQTCPRDHRRPPGLTRRRPAAHFLG